MFTSENRVKLNELEIFRNKVTFEFKDGWTDLVYNLGKDITELCELTNCELPYIQQIKEKFGTLKFYYNCLNSEYPEIVKKSIKALVRQAEIKSSDICETCGEKGKVKVCGGIYSSVCEEHEGNCTTVEEWKKLQKAEKNNINIEQFEEVFNYKEYLSFMESKKVRHGKDRTNTLLDFVSEEQRAIDKAKGIVALSVYDATPVEIKEHFDFVNEKITELREKYPSDKFLESLENDEKMQEIFISKNWYESYGIAKTNIKTYFGINIYKDKLVKLDDIKELPFYDFFDNSMKGSTYQIINDKDYIYLHDWESFCKHFIKTGKHRYLS